MKQRVGIFGGTFDPAHSSHFELAATAQKEYRLDRIIFIPAAVPPHKTVSEITSFLHRVRMLEIACADHDTFECSTIEGTLAKPSYTIDTLKALLARMGEENKLYFIIGCDAFLDILSWKSYKEVVCLVTLIVSKRKGTDEKQLASLADILEYKRTSKSLWSSRSGGKNIFFLQQTPADLSSTFIKHNINNDLIVKDTISKKIIEYIRLNGLYHYNKP